MSMFQDKSDIVGAAEFGLHREAIPGTRGKKCRLITNCFKISMNPNGVIYHYRYTLTPPAATPEEEQWALQQIWGAIEKQFGVFVVRCPGHIFAPTTVSSDLQFNTPAEAKLGYAAHDVSIKMYQRYSSEQVNTGVMGEADVVAQHVVKKLVEPLMYQKVGRRYFNNVDCMEGKAQLAVFSGFYAAMNSLSQHGPQMQIDMMYRCLNKRNIIDSLAGCLDGGGSVFSLNDDDVKAEWRRHCLCSTVVTLYNNMVYRIKDIHFNKTPKDCFTMFLRDEKEEKQISFVQYYSSYYNKDITQLQQPLLEAYAEKDTEVVFLVPELCALTGFNEEMRKDKNLMADALKMTKGSPQERLSAVQSIANDIAKGMSVDETSTSTCSKQVQDWKFSFNQQPVETDGRVFDPLEVSFGQKKYTIEEGNFQRWMRNGLQCPSRLDDWFFIYPESDVPVVDIWLRSLRDIAQGAFAMKMADPQRIICTDQKREITKVIEDRLTPKTQMILLLTPQKDARRVYQEFKRATCAHFPCVTQVVKSETIRKRQSIAAVLSRIVLQINAKFSGPLWHINLDTKGAQSLFTYPTMIIGIDVFRTHEQEQYVGFAASLGTHCSEYYSTASCLDADKPRQSMSVKIQKALRDAILHFVRRNDGLLPEHFIVYRASADQADWPTIKATEIDAINAVLQTLSTSGGLKNVGSTESGLPYTPQLTFVAISKRNGMRFFLPSLGNQQTVKNPEPGTVIDSPVCTGLDTHSFYLVNQAVTKGTATPTHYTVLFDSAQMQSTTLQDLTYRLSFLYYNYTGSIKMPAPAQYAKKVAHLVGTAVRTDPHKRLLCTFFYL